MDSLLVISPHLDDAVISCGSLLLAHPGATVVTLFAASLAAYTNPLNEHDTQCGFQPGDDTMAIRRADADPACIVAPLGLLHADHQATHTTALALRERVEGRAWLWYSDLPYAYIPRVLDARMRILHEQGSAVSSTGRSTRSRRNSCPRANLLPARPGASTAAR
jgi:LmbE family N-acetylglucosaminyl deacetylase